jgi:hypothetical protein
LIEDNQEQNSERIFCAALLQNLLDKKTTSQDIIDKWPKQTGDYLIDNIYSLLFHYRDDVDIRIKDSRYASWQDGDIRGQIKALVGERKEKIGGDVVE